MLETNQPAEAPGDAQLRRKIRFSSGWVTRHIRSIKKLLPLFEGAASLSNAAELMNSRDQRFRVGLKPDTDTDTLILFWRI